MLEFLGTADEGKEHPAKFVAKAGEARLKNDVTELRESEWADADPVKTFCASQGLTLFRGLIGFMQKAIWRSPICSGHTAG